MSSFNLEKMFSLDVILSDYSWILLKQLLFLSASRAIDS